MADNKNMEARAFFKKLEGQNLTELERKTGVTRQALHNARKSRNMKLDNLTAVAKALNLELVFQPSLSEANLLGSLVDLGVPLAHSGEGSLSLHQAVAEGLKASRKDGTYESLLPYLLVKNADKLEPLNLAAAAFSTREVNPLGYFVEIANAYQPHPRLRELLRLLEPAKDPTSTYLVEGQKTQFPELFKKNPFALKWNLLVRGTPEAHFERWKKWQRLQKRS
jgi:hypothetical protein